MRNATKKIILLGTGGTIAGIPSDPAIPHVYSDSQLRIEAVSGAVPQPPGVRVKAMQLWNLPSGDFTEANLRGLYLHINQLLRRTDVAGVVLTQGTDTIEETAFFLDSTLRTGKPVIVTGAMRPSGALSSDAQLNIYQSVALAAHPSACHKGTLILMNERIYSPADTVKAHTFANDSFACLEWGPLGIMLGNEPRWARLRTPSRLLDIPPNFAITPLPRVDIIIGHIGIDPDIVRSTVSSGVAGFVYAGTGNGSVAIQLKSALVDAAQQGCVVVRASRAPSGFVGRNVSANDDELLTVAAMGHSALKARLLLQLGLAHKLPRPALQQLFEQ